MIKYTIKTIKILISVSLLSRMIYTGTKSESIELLKALNPTDFIIACFFHFPAFTVLLVDRSTLLTAL